MRRSKRINSICGNEYECLNQNEQSPNDFIFFESNNQEDIKNYHDKDLFTFTVTPPVIPFTETNNDQYYSDNICMKKIEDRFNNQINLDEYPDDPEISVIFNSANKVFQDNELGSVENHAKSDYYTNDYNSQKLMDLLCEDDQKNFYS